MEHRQLGRSGLKVPVLSLGTGTFGGVGEFFKRWGETDASEARRLVDICLDAGLNFFDTADIYSSGASEEVLAAALKGRRDRALIATKATFTSGPGPNDKGSSRWYLTRALDASLKRLHTDYIDLYFMHGFDALTPTDELMSTLDGFVRAGKVRYLGCSNYSGWHVVKAQTTAERYGYSKFVSYQGYYSLIGRDYEHELMPMALDQGLGTMVWSPLGWGRLTGKIRRGQAADSGRIASGGAAGGPEVEDEYLFQVVDALAAIAEETEKTIPQIALNWLLRRPGVANVVVGARNEAQLAENLGALSFELTEEQIQRLDAASRRTPPYPYWHQMGFNERNPKPTHW
jgi:aryl-alcohol dehydrogenase-like predicted oxidoreductase